VARYSRVIFPAAFFACIIYERHSSTKLSRRAVLRESPSSPVRRLRFRNVSSEHLDLLPSRSRERQNALIRDERCGNARQSEVDFLSASTRAFLIMSSCWSLASASGASRCVDSRFARKPAGCRDPIPNERCERRCFILSGDASSRLHQAKEESSFRRDRLGFNKIQSTSTTSRPPVDRSPGRG
jgi:hypothetical protein